ncbi:MAG TPA: glycosyltransferase family 2 protein [Frankiaceae bacterium]|nr:glycosyltransferase family 2 protein [Frankiaceae bacterium]
MLPCYNEVGHVEAELERIAASLDDSGYVYDLDVYDDCSSDGTRELLAQIAESGRFPRMRYFPRHRNGGSGTIRRIGSQNARGEYVAWTDADMTYPNERIPEMVDMLVKDDQYDQVVGARTTEEGTYKLLRVPAKWVIRKIAERLTGTKIPDLNSGLRVFRREVSLPYLPLLPPGFSCVTTLTVSFLSNAHDVHYLPIDYAKRAGRSKFHFTKDAYRYILQVLRMVMYFNPLKVLMPLALFILTAGTAKLAYDLIAHPFRVTGVTILTIVTGFQIAALALIADLIVRSRQQR